MSPVVVRDRSLSHAADLLDPAPPTIDPYLHDCASWVRDMFDWDRVGKTPSAYQYEIMQQLPIVHRASVRGPHGLGKTALASWVVHWFCHTRESAQIDWKVLTTASNWRQLEKFLWPEIHKWSKLLLWDKLGRPPYKSGELLQLNLKMKFGSASAIASDTPEALEGAHADSLLFLFDESKAIQSGIFDAVEGAFSGAGSDTAAEAFALAISTPGEPNGRFYEIQTKKPGTEDWWVRAVSLGEALQAGRVSIEWVDQRKKQWGEENPVYINRVLGEFATDDIVGIIPSLWVEQAQDRWRAFYEAGNTPDPDAFTCVGVDVARSGMDKTVIAIRYGAMISELREALHADTMTTTGVVNGVLSARKPGYAAVDVIGLGAGVVDRLREQGFEVKAFNAAMKTEQVDISGELGFTNLRSAAWWTMRELLDPTNEFNVLVPTSDLLLGELTTPHWRVTSSGKIQVESKDDIRKRLGRSTDYADAVMMAFALIPVADFEAIYAYEERVEISPY